jgi:tetratricopeptide (TPR) repeat protein
MTTRRRLLLLALVLLLPALPASATCDETSLLLLGPDGLADPDVRGRNAEVEATLRQGLDAELAARYQDAERLYTRATELDPTDATALRYLGELYRHQTGEWAKAKAVFERVLAMPADPIARAVALHGLGKMTIHAGRFADGLAMFEKSLAVHPLPITYRNLAVYWFSERQAERAAGYMRQALALDPDDRYNQIFAAVYLAAAGQKEEAAKVAAANADVLEASYNLAAIWAQVGDRKKAMELLRRHFYDYERFDARRAMEMQEARDDYMFASLHQDPEFVELTKLATRHRM